MKNDSKIDWRRAKIFSWWKRAAATTKKRTGDFVQHTILAEMITDFLVADVMFFGLIKSVIVVICCGYDCFEFIQTTAMEKTTLRSN